MRSAKKQRRFRVQKTAVLRRLHKSLTVRRLGSVRSEMPLVAVMPLMSQDKRLKIRGVE